MEGVDSAVHPCERPSLAEDAVAGARRPLADRGAMAEEGGLDRVLDVVGRMSWGIPA
jgi:hypothetical protein